MRVGLICLVSSVLLFAGACASNKSEKGEVKGEKEKGERRELVAPGASEEGKGENAKGKVEGPVKQAVPVKEEAAGEEVAAGNNEATGEEVAAGKNEATGEEVAAGNNEVAVEDDGTFKHLPIDEIKKRQKRFAPVKITWDKSLLNEKEVELVKTLVRAARVMDHIFWMQASPDGLEWRKKLAKRRDLDSRALFHYLMVNYGIYDRLSDNEPFIGDQPRPAGAGYYPVDITKEEFEKWLADHPDDAKTFKSQFTVIRRQGDKLVAQPYSQAYARELQAAHRLLLQAAGQAENESLKKYLTSRAEAFLSDDYYQSDMDWMDLDSRIEVTIGPYEVYEDHLFGYKAAFEAFITAKDPEATARLATFADWLDKLEKNLPIPDGHKNFKRGAGSPMPVVDVIFTAGDTRAGVQTIAFNLPNDERVREQKGSKKVLLRNIGKAKFHRILKPIAGRVLRENRLPFLHEESYFNHTLLHEISHALGPGTIIIDGKKTTVNLTLQELYSALEEAKADTLGLYNALFLIDKEVVKLPSLDAEGASIPDKLMTKEEAKTAVLATFLAGIFRSTRFGVHEAHGKANLLIFNYLTKAGGFVWDSQGRVDFDFEKAPGAISALATELLMIQAKGDYEAGKAFIATYGEVSKEMRKALERLNDVPVDIEPVYDLP